MTKRLVAVCLCMLALADARADLGAGIAALKKGDYASALTELRPVAEQGSAEAQEYLGAPGPAKRR